MPTDEEVAAEMGIQPKELQDIFTKLSYTSVVSFEELWLGGEKDEHHDALSTIKDETAEDPVAIFESCRDQGDPRRRNR